MKKPREKIYIVPTWFGLAFGGGILLCLLVASTYGNNLAYLLSFFMLGIFLIAMISTHSNIRGVHLDALRFDLGEEHKSLRARVWLKNEGREPKFLFHIRWKGLKKGLFYRFPKVDTKSLASQDFDLPVGEFGIYKVSKIEVSTVFPLGLFYAWKAFVRDIHYIVYPQPLGGDLSEKNMISGDHLAQSLRHQGEDFSQHKNYAPGESHHHVDWKAYARGRGLYLKEFLDGESHSVRLDWQDCVGSKEQRLRQMSYWIHQCHQKGLSFSLYHGKKKLIEKAEGANQRRRALSYLVEELAREV